MNIKRTAAHWGSYIVDPNKIGSNIIPDPTDPAPSLLGKGWVDAVRDNAVRIMKPAIRKGWLEGDGGKNRCNDRFVEVSWDIASKHVAEEIKRVSETYGNEAIYGGSYGWASTGRFHHAQSQLKRFLNLTGGFTASKDTYSHAVAEVLFPHITGMTNRQFQDHMTSWPLIGDHCELFLAFGGVSGRTAQISSSGTSTHDVEYWLKRAAKKGMNFINISPQSSDGKDMPNTEWLSIRPGTDTALMLALAYEIHEKDAHDIDFIRRYTSGWKTFQSYLVGETDGIAKSADWAAKICDIPADIIRSLAIRMINSRTMIAVTWGVQRADHGEQPIWAGLALAAMLGQIGQPGTGFGFGYGCTTLVGRPARLVNWPSVPQGQNNVTDFIPVARVTDMLLNPGGDYHYNGSLRQYPDIRLIYWAGGNPFHHQEDLNRLERAWLRPETVIVNDHSWTATARRADIILPCSSPLERNDIMINRRDKALIYMSKIMEPVGEALSDYHIFSKIALHLGFEKNFTEDKNEEEWLRWLWSQCQKQAKNEKFNLPNFETLCELGRIDVPDSNVTQIQMKAFISNPETRPLDTESGKITLSNDHIAQMNLKDCPGHPAWLPPIEWLGDAEADQFHLISGQPATRLHSQLDNGPISKKTKISDREPCVLHPEAAARYEIAENEIILLFNQRGACLAGVKLSDTIKQNCISLATGAWFDPQMIDGQKIEVHGNPNVLTIDKGASGLSQGNIGHTALVRIRKWDGGLPPLTVHKPPLFTN